MYKEWRCMEQDFRKRTNKSEKKKIVNHRITFITTSDFQDFSAAQIISLRNWVCKLPHVSKLFKIKRKYTLLCCSVAQSCPIVCDPMDCSIPDFPVLHHLLKFAQIHVHESVMSCKHFILCCRLLLLPSVS